MKWIFAICTALIFSPAGLEAEVYLTKEQALEVVFGRDCVVNYEPQVFSDGLKRELTERGLGGEAQASAHFFSCTQDGQVKGYALIDSEIGKHLPITYIVGFSPAGTVTRVEMMVFREIRGWEARERRFMAQFEDKTVADELVIGATLQNVTGATLSSRAIAKGVKRALYLFNHFYKPPSQ